MRPIHLETEEGNPRDVFHRAAREFSELRGSAEQKAYAESIVRFSTETNFDCLSVLRALDLAYKEMLPGGKNKSGGIMILDGVEQYFESVGHSAKLLIPFRVRRKEVLDEELSEAEKLIARIHTNSAIVKNLPWFTQEKGKHAKFTTDEFVEDSRTALSHVRRDTVVLRGNPTPGMSLSVVVTIARSVSSLQSISMEMLKKNQLDERAIRALIMIGIPDHLPKVTSLQIARSTYESIFYITKKLVVDSPGGTNSGEISRIRYEISRQIKAASENPCKGIPDILTHKWDGISLQDIISFKAKVARSEGALNRDYAQNDRLGKMILRYIAAVPGGDYLWQRIVDGLFLAHSNADEINASLQPEEIQFAEKVFKFQKWLTEKLLLPSFADIYPKKDFAKKFAPYLVDDPEFTLLLGKAVNHMDRAAATHLGTVITQNAQHAPGTIHRFHPKVTLNEALAICPLSIIAGEQAIARDHIQVFHINREVNRLLNSRWIQIRDKTIQMLTGRVDFRKMNYLYLGLITSISADYDEVSSKHLIDSIRENLGGNFFERLAPKKAEIEEINGIIREEMLNIDYWPHSHLSHVIEFSLETLPEIMGFKSIQFIVSDNMQEKVGFQLRVADDSWGIGGHIEPDGKVNLMVVEDQLPEGLKSILDHIVLAYFRDLLVVGKIETRERRPVKTSRPKQLGDEKKEKKKETKPRPVSLLRTKVIFTTGPNIVASKDVKEVIETTRTSSGFTPRRIGTHRMKLRGVDAYLKVVTEYEQATDDATREEKYLALVETRKRLAQPSAEKIRNLSTTRFQLDDLRHPLTDQPLHDTTRDANRILKLQTWVKQFEVPALTPEEIASLPLRYTRRYKAGSATAFGDNELVLWIKGVDAGVSTEEETE